MGPAGPGLRGRSDDKFDILARFAVGAGVGRGRDGARHRSRGGFWKALKRLGEALEGAQAALGIGAG
jgi:hypothetical protein